MGCIGINRFTGPAREHCAELGFGVAKGFTQRGIGTRLFSAAIQQARQMGLRRLEVDCFDDNVAAMGLTQKCGFREEGQRVGAICRDGKLRNQRLFALML